MISSYFIFFISFKWAYLEKVDDCKKWRLSKRTMPHHLVFIMKTKMERNVPESPS